MWKNLLKAARYSRECHAGQLRAHGEPYYKHPMAVARLLWYRGHSEENLIIAAYLHDVVEDSGVALSTIQLEFGEQVAAYVSAVTKNPGESREAYFRRIKAAGAKAMALKLADRDHNNSQLSLAPKTATALREKARAKTALMLQIFSE